MLDENETKWLFVILLTSEILVGAINGFTAAAGSGAAAAALTCTAAAAAFFAVTESIRRCDDVPFFDMIKSCYGKTASAAIGSVLTVISLFGCARSVRIFTSAVADVVLTQSPALYIAAFFAAAMLAVSVYGLQTLSRYAIAAGKILAVFVLVIVIFNIKNLRLSNALPIFGNGADGMASSVGMVYIFSDILYLCVISDHFQSRGAVMRVGSRSLIISGLFAVCAVFVYCCSVAYPASTHFRYPIFRLAALANTSVLLQRLDGAVYILWLIAGFISCGARALFTSVLFEKSFDCGDSRGIAPTVILAAIMLSGIVPKDGVRAAFACTAVVIYSVTIITYRLWRISNREQKTD